ncbi:MAG: LysR family transcriptional regulator [Neomegalonema sp.]|nr:LysR family transcriptional regulator [Neomegalonema sp.]
MDRFSEMEAFVRVVEAGGFTEAARRAGVSKSAISKQVSSLEQRLGARLLDRTTRRVSPTEIGLAYYDRATRALAEAEEADAAAMAMQGDPRGELRLTAPQSFGRRILTPIVAEFLETHPQVRINMTLDDRFVELVSEGYDLAIRVGVLEDSVLKARRLGETKMILVASSEYLAKSGAPTRVEDLNDHALLHYSYLASGRSWRLAGSNGAERVVRAGGPLAVNNGEALLVAAEKGLGIAYLPEFIIEDSLSAGRVQALLPESRQPALGVWAVTPPGPFTQPKVRAFIDFAAKRLKASSAGR